MIESPSAAGLRLPDRLATESAILALATRMRARFTAVASRSVASRADAEDIVQDFYVRVIRSAGSVTSGESVRAWLFCVLRSVVIDHVRRERRRALIVKAREREIAASESTSECECLRDALPTLRTCYAEVIERVDLGEERLDGMALRLQTRPATLRVRLFRARKQLSTKMPYRCATCPVRCEATP